MLLEIKGVSQKGKNRIREHGKTWKVIKKDATVICRVNKPGMLVEAMDGYQRWLILENDPDFLIIGEKE